MEKLDLIDSEPIIKEALKDPEVKKHYDALELEYRIVETLAEKRVERNLSQKEIARRMGTKQSAVARFESGQSNPTIGFISRFINALESKAELSIT